MRRAALALALLCAVAQAEPPKDPVFAMLTWQQLGTGAGEVRVYGPIDRGLCLDNLPLLTENLSKDVSPDLQLGVRTCAPALQLQSYVAAFNCVAVDHSHTPKSAAQVWLYRCLGFR